MQPTDNTGITFGDDEEAAVYTYYAKINEKTDDPSPTETLAASVTFDEEALAAIKEAAGDSNTTVKLVIEKTSETTTEGTEGDESTTTEIVYDIKLVDNEGNTIPYEGGEATVKVPFPDYDDEKVYSLYYHDGNNKCKIDATYIGGYFVFKTSHFSEYSIIAQSEEEVEKNIAVKLVQKDADDPSKWDIVLATTDQNKSINRFTAADLTFELSSNNIGYTIAGANYVNVYPQGDGQYQFNMNGVDYPSMSSEKGGYITIGTVTFTGYDTFTFKVDSNSAVVNTTSLKDNINRVHTVTGDVYKLTVTTTAPEDPTTVAEATATTGEITLYAPKAKLDVNVVFPNAISANAATYQDMKVTISGGDLSAPIEIALGDQTTAAETEINNRDGSKGKYTVKFATAAAGTLADQVAYTISVENALTKNVMYNVTVEGAGYRTTRYSVTMTDDKTLTFWNNVMDENTVIEAGKDPTVKVTFLAGDIVEDNVINIYDLSAVVSYFGTEGLSTDSNPEYAQYDLNRDGKIDSIDVAYVLVSWGE